MRAIKGVSNNNMTGLGFADSDIKNFVQGQLFALVPLIQPTSTPVFVLVDKDGSRQELSYTPHLIRDVKGEYIDMGEAFVLNPHLFKRSLKQYKPINSPSKKADKGKAIVNRGLLTIYMTLRYFALEHMDYFQGNLLRPYDCIRWVEYYEPETGQQVKSFIKESKEIYHGKDFNAQVDTILMGAICTVMANRMTMWGITPYEFALYFKMKKNEVVELLERGFETNH